ncbi:hypothetical protein PS15m_003726 [Mucor circinelloides]
MEYLEEKITSKSQERVKVSLVFEENADQISAICNRVEQDISLKDYWSDTVKRLKASLGTKVVADLYMIDFENLELKRQLHRNKMKIKASVVQAQTDEIAMLFNPNPEFQKPCMTNIVSIKKLNDQLATLNYEPDLGKKDLLYYHIVDLDTRNSHHSSNIIFSKEERNEHIKHYKSSFPKNNEIDIAARSIFQIGDSDWSLKKQLKTRKAYVRNLAPSLKKTMLKRVIKVVKVYEHTPSSFSNFNENEFTFLFLLPVLRQILKSNNLSFKLGESHLKCVTKHINDESRAAVGPKIDIIITSEALHAEVSVVEVSGPVSKVDKSHFLGDRSKIAKNLRLIYKQIEKLTNTPSLSDLKKLKLYGLQVYLNTIYVYSLSKCTANFYVFLLEKKIIIPTNPAMYKDQIPHFLGRLWILNNMLSDTVENIQAFLNGSRAQEYPSSDSDISSVEISPRKKQKTKA